MTSPGAYVDDRVSLGHCCLDPMFFLTAVPLSGGLSQGEKWDVDCEREQQLISRRRCLVYELRGVC